MSAGTVHTLNDRSTSNAPAPTSARRWIISSPVDQALILLTPLLAIPIVLLLYSPYVGITAETISLIVTSFFATGHHLPGLIRAYGDRELFQRFRWRFLLAPPLVFLAYFPLYTYHFGLYRLIILTWATWHGLMQLYGFVRIYDAKVGSVGRWTARWDWLVCLCGFITPQLLRPESLTNVLNHWYSSGGPLVAPWVLSAGRWTCLALSVAALVGFAVNYVVQWSRGPRPNPLKVVMLASGVGTWWFAMCYVENLLLGVALFDICHDLQYLAIVWLYNCKRVGSQAQLGGFMKYVFRRGMVLLYLGLITAYGAVAFCGSLVLDGTVSRVFYGVLFTSTILHYYYDGFIWKVREAANQESLGLSPGVATSRAQQVMVGRLAHLLKWSPAIVGLGWLFAADLVDPSVSTVQAEKLEQRYLQSLAGRGVLPPSDVERSWLYARFEQTLNIAAAVPADRKAQLRAVIVLANFGRHDEAIERLESILREHPDDRDAHVAMGDIQLFRGNLEQAAAGFQSALSQSNSAAERAVVNLKLGEILLEQKEYAAARLKFDAARSDDPSLGAMIDAVCQKVPALSTPP